MNKRIIIIEPYCVGYEHVEFNSAFILYICKKNINDRLVLLMDSDHYKQIITKLENSHVSITNEIKFIPITITKYSNSIKNAKRCISYYTKILESIHSYILTDNYEIYILSSESIGILSVIRLTQTMGIEQRKVTIILHSVLKRCFELNKRFWNYKENPRHAIKELNRSNINVLVLSKNIFDNVKWMFSSGHLWYIEHPYIFDQINNGKDSTSKGIKIGIMGAIREPLEDYYYIAKEVRKAHREVEFIIVGHITNRALFRAKYGDVFKNVSFIPRDYSNMKEIISRLDYVLWFPKDEYRFIASCTLLDSFNYNIPGFYRESDLVKHYFAIMGEIGYIGRNRKDIVAAIEYEIDKNNKKKFSDNIRVGKCIFSPENIVLRNE